MSLFSSWSHKHPKFSFTLASFSPHNGVHFSSIILPTPPPNFTSLSYPNSPPLKDQFKSIFSKAPPTLITFSSTLKVNNAQGEPYHFAPILDSGVWCPNWYDCMLLNGPGLIPTMKAFYTHLQRCSTLVTFRDTTGFTLNNLRDLGTYQVLLWQLNSFSD